VHWRGFRFLNGNAATGRQPFGNQLILGGPGLVGAGGAEIEISAAESDDGLAAGLVMGAFGDASCRQGKAPGRISVEYGAFQALEPHRLTPDGYA
jgi:hypothetical protein